MSTSVVLPDVLGAAWVASAKADSLAIEVPDAHLLFTGEFQRVGTTGLRIVGDDGTSFYISDYFDDDKLAPLMSPEGATLSERVVETLAGPLAPGQLAQASGQATSQPVIGRVDALTGSASVVRNGVTVALNVGDNVRRGDVVQTSGASSVAIVLADGSTFSLNANARMVLDNFLFNQGGTGNSATISLVQGAFSFIAGQIAKTGEMRVETPVATLGIRGTAVLVEISAADGRTRFSVMVEPDGTTGSFNIYNKSTGALIATVNSAQTAWVVTPVGPLQVVAQQEQKTPAQLQQELGIVQQIFTIFDNNQQNPFVPPSDNQERRGEAPNNGNSTAQAGGSGEPLTVSVQVSNPEAVNLVTTAAVTITHVDVPPGSSSGLGAPITTVGLGTDNPSLPGGESAANPFDFSKATSGQTVNGSERDDLIIGSSFDDTIDAGAGNDQVLGGPGNDTIVGGHGEGDDRYDGGAGADVVSFLSANGMVFHLNESLLPNGQILSRSQSFSTDTDHFTGIETIIASPGSDVFYVHLDGSWILDGRAGFDTLSFEARADGIVVSLNNVGSSTGWSGSAAASLLGTITFTDIEALRGSPCNDTFSIQNLTGHNAAPGSGLWTLEGGAGTDDLRIQGISGLKFYLNAEIASGPAYSTIYTDSGELHFSGFERVLAGAGHDTFILQGLPTTDVDAGAGIDTVRSNNGLDVTVSHITNFEIIDLLTDNQSNTVLFDIADFARIGSAPLRILGQASDIFKLTALSETITEIVQSDSNVLAAGVFSDSLTDGVRFDVYRVRTDTSQHVFYLQHGTGFGVPVGANDDQALMRDRQNTIVDVLANDVGGSLARLTALDVKSIIGPEGTVIGNPLIAIVGNKLSIIPGTAFDALRPGDVATIVINYTMENSLGEPSTATATITVAGGNQAPVVIGPRMGFATEDGGVTTLSGLENAHDPDGDTLGLIVVLNNLPAGVTYNNTTSSFSLDPRDTAFQSLATGEEVVVSVQYHVSDGLVTVPASVSWTVTGVNDGPDARDVVLQAEFFGNGGFEAGFQGWLVDPSPSGLNQVFFSEAFVDRTGSIIDDDFAVAVLKFSGQLPNQPRPYTNPASAEGPSIVSTSFFGEAGETIRFVYQLSSGANAASFDAGKVTSKIIDVNTGQVIETVHDEVGLGSTTQAQTVNFQLSFSGEFRIEISVGSIDETLGLVVGTELDLGFAGIIKSGLSEDSAFKFDPSVFLADATDAEGDPISLASVSNSAFGATVTLNEDGSLTYDPRASLAIQDLDGGETIEDSFTFILKDAHGGFSNVATARITIHGVDELLVA